MALRCLGGAESNVEGEWNGGLTLRRARSVPLLFKASAALPDTLIWLPLSLLDCDDP